MLYVGHVEPATLVFFEIIVAASDVMKSESVLNQEILDITKCPVRNSARHTKRVLRDSQIPGSKIEHIFWKRC